MVTKITDAVLILLGERGEMNAEAMAARINLEERFKAIRDKWHGSPITRDQVYAAMGGLRSKSSVERTYIQPASGRVGAHQAYQLTGYGAKKLREMAHPVARMSPKPEAVDHPAHYGGGDNPYEAIKVIEAWSTPEEFIGGLKFNVLKYLSRAGKKDNGKLLEDLKKARWYLDYLINWLEKLNVR